MKNVASILICCLFCIAVFGQQDSVLKTSLINTIKGGVKNFSTDNLGNLYLLTVTNQLKKVNEKGDSIAAYNDIRRFGKIFSIDATNPLKVLVYYKEFSTIVVLDRLLDARTTIDLRRQNILQVTAVTSSYDNNIWLYDELDSKIKKIDDKGNVLLESTDFRQIFDSVPSPSVMYDRDGLLYLYDKKKGLMVFDYYGGKKNNYQLLNLSDVQVLDKNTITARDSSHILLYKPKTLQLFSFKAFTNSHDYDKISFNANRIYCLTNTGNLQIFGVAEGQTGGF